MKRLDMIKMLIQEGLSEKTLVNFSDEQIFALSKRMLGEQVLNVSKDNKAAIDQAKKTKQNFVTYEEEMKEELKGNQKKLDKNHNGKIDAQDFKILKGQKKKEVSEEKPSTGLSKEKKSEVVKAAKSGKDIGKKGKGFKEIEKKAKESGADNPKAVAGAAMWKNIKRESKKDDSQKNESTEVKEWLNNIVESEYHPFTSKGEILSLIKTKLSK